MKKLLASLLAMVLALSLAVPAFADDPAPGVGIIGGADGPTEIVTGPLGGTFNWWTADDEAIDELKTALGGVPGQVGVMVNGAYVKFPDAVPEVTKGRTMVPVRALVETLGGEIDYLDGTVKFVLDGYAYEFVIGKTTVTVTPTAGNDKDTPKPDDIVMDCAPYIKGGRTYVPIRFISEALGYEVGWDGDFQTAILVDREALAAGIDKNFTILNKVQAANALTLKEGESAQADLKGKVALTMASLEGNKTYDADFTISGLMNEQAMNGAMTLNVSDALVELLMAQGGMDEEDGKAVQMILGALKKFEFILNADGRMWVHSDGLDGMAGQKNVWFGTSLDMTGMDLSTLLAAGAQVSTVGEAVAVTVGTDSVMGWAMVNQIVEMMGIYSDDKFTTTGDTSTLTIGIDELMDIYENMGLSAEDMAAAMAVFKEYKITMKVDSKGGATVSFVVETVAQSGVPGIKMTMDGKQSGGEAEMTMEINVAGMGKLELTLTSTQKATSNKPATEPPKDATIVDDGAMPLNP